MLKNTTATLGVTLPERALPILTAVDTAIILIDCDNLVTFMNPLAEELIGWSRGDAIHQPLWAICRFLPDTQAFLLEEQTNHQLFNVHGQVIPVTRMVVPMQMDENQTDGYAILLYDQREFGEISKPEVIQITQAKQEWEATADALPQLIALLDEDGRIVRINRTIEKWGLGSVRDIYGKTVPQLLHPNLPTEQSYLTDLLSTAWPKLKRGQSIETEINDTQLQRQFNILIQPLNNHLPGSTFAVIVLRDITERKQLEAELNQAQKMETIGRLVGGVAHEFNNILMAISGDCELIANQLESDNPAHSQFATIKKYIGRGTHLTRQLLTFGRKAPYQPTAVDVGEAINELKALLRRLMGSEVELRCKIEPNLGLAEFDKNQFEQVMLNLAANARDAMPDGGRLTIKVEQFSAVQQERNMPPQPYIRVSVKDNGVGIPSYDQPHIFEPFFTTKSSGHGTGLGLTTIHNLMKQNRGHVSFVSKPGVGTTFYLDLPLANASEKSSSLSIETHLPTTPATVLVVEDEASVLDIIEKALTRHGYQVIRATHGKEALHIINQQTKPPDLLITDVIMPEGINGHTLAEQLKADYPQLKVLFISGYTDSNQVTFAPWMDFLQKPFGLNLLTQRVQRLLLS